MTTPELFYQQILFYATDGTVPASLESAAHSLGLRLFQIQTPEEFLQLWTEERCFLNLVVTSNWEQLQSWPKFQSNLTLPPLLLAGPHGNESMDRTLLSNFDDFIFDPVETSRWERAFGFWSTRTPIFDQGAIEKLALSNGVDLVKKVLESFDKSLRTTRPDLLSALDQGDIKALASGTHSIKASAKVVGAEALFNLCAWMELKYQWNSPVSEKFKAHFQQILLKSQKYFEVLSSIPGERLLGKR